MWNLGVLFYLSFTVLLRIYEHFVMQLQKYGKIDVVVSNAAANPSVDNILQTKESVLDKLWDINVKTAILFLQVYFLNIHWLL